jgi:adenosine deaminase
MTKTNEATWFERVPKVELHLHLEGAIPLNALWTLIQKYGGEPSVTNIQALKRKFRYRDFYHFLGTWIWKNQFIREYDDFTYIAEVVARDLAHQNIRYVEAFYSPSDFFRHGLETQRITEAIRAGLRRVPEIEVMLVTDFCRNNGPEKAAKILPQVNEVKSLGVIGVTIGGSEQNNPPEPYAVIYEKARQLGFHTSAHAGEAAGPDSIWGAIRSLKVERIGHGTRAFEDANLVAFLAGHRIPLEMCPISNVRTGVVESLKKHPIRSYHDSGIIVTINTDDPKMFGNSLAEEYKALETELNFTRQEIQNLILQSIQASWLSENRKRELARAFCDDPGWQIEPQAAKG